MEQGGWTDEYIPLLLQVYFSKPVGVKAAYSRRMVDLSQELHVPPRELHDKMRELRQSERKSVRRLWQRYELNRRRLNADCRKLRSMAGFNNAEVFYEGVECRQTFEQAFMPLAEEGRLTPAMLIIILNTYFQLLPITMVPETPEVQALARQLKIDARLVADVMTAYQQCDPFFDRGRQSAHALHEPCARIWQLYAGGNPTELSTTAEQMAEYFKG